MSDDASGGDGADPSFAERLDALIGTPVGSHQPSVGPDPVNQPMMRHWAAAFEDHNPVYVDPEFAATTRFGGVVAPAMVDDLGRVIDRWKPDLLVHEPAAFAVPLVCTSRGLVHVCHGYGLRPPAGHLSGALREFSRQWPRARQLPPEDGGVYRHRYIDIMPRRLQVEFSGVVQQHTDAHGGEVSADDIWNLFRQAYLENAGPVRYREHHLFEHGEAQGIRLSVDIDGVPHLLTGEGNGPINAAMHALESAGIKVQVRSYEERSMAPMGDDGNARACAFMEVAGNGNGDFYGVGIDGNIVTASLKALVSGINRLGSAVQRQPVDQAAAHGFGNSADVGHDDHRRLLVEDLRDRLGEIGIGRLDQVCEGRKRTGDVVERRQQRLRLVGFRLRDQADPAALRVLVQHAHGGGLRLAIDGDGGEVVAQFERHGDAAGPGGGAGCEIDRSIGNAAALVVIGADRDAARRHIAGRADGGDVEAVDLVGRRGQAGLR